MYRTALFMALALFLSVKPSLAEEIQGTVNDENNAKPVSGALVLLVQDELLKESITDSQGRYAFQRIDEGSYRIEVSAFGYKKNVLPVTLQKGDSLVRDIVMIRDDFQLEELVVSEKVLDPEVVMQTGFVSLDNETLNKIPSVLEPDPLRALQVLPGVQAASDISSGLYIRGGGPDQNLVLMDGVTVYNPTHAFGFFSTFNSDVVKDVSLYKGAYPAQYGGRLGAVLDVKMKEP